MASSSSSSSSMNLSFRKMTGQPEENSLDEMCQQCPKMTYQQRIIGFCACVALGYLLSFIGTLCLINTSPEGVRTFIVLYVIGNLIAIFATLFLIGPLRQCKKMFHKTRRYSTIFYLVTLIVVFAVAVARQNIFLVLFLLLIQWCAGIWYAASYIPFGRKMILSCLKNTICSPCKPLFEKKGWGSGGGSGDAESGGSGLFGKV